MAARRAALAPAVAALLLLLPCVWAGLCFAGLRPPGRRQRTGSAAATALWKDIKGRFRFGKPANGDGSILEKVEAPVLEKIEGRANGDDSILEKVEASVLEKIEGRFRFRGATTPAVEDAATPEEPLGVQVLERRRRSARPPGLGQFRFKAAAASEEPLGTSVLEKANGQVRFTTAATPEEAPNPPTADAVAPPEAGSRSDLFRNGLLLLGAGAVGLQLQLSREAEERERARKAAEEKAAREGSQGLLPLLPFALVGGLALPGLMKMPSQVETRIKQSKEDAKVEKALGSMFSSRYLSGRTYDSGQERR